MTTCTDQLYFHSINSHYLPGGSKTSLCFVLYYLPRGIIYITVETECISFNSDANLINVSLLYTVVSVEALG